MMKKNDGETVGGIDIMDNQFGLSMNPQRVYDMGLIMIPLVYLMFVGVGFLSSISLELSLVPATIVSVITVGVLMFVFYPVHLRE